MRVPFVAFALGVLAALGPQIRNRKLAKGLLMEPMLTFAAREAVRLLEMGHAAYFGPDLVEIAAPDTSNLVFSSSSKALLREPLFATQAHMLNVQSPQGMVQLWVAPQEADSTNYLQNPTEWAKLLSILATMVLLSAQMLQLNVPRSLDKLELSKSSVRYPTTFTINNMSSPRKLFQRSITVADIPALMNDHLCLRVKIKHMDEATFPSLHSAKDLLFWHEICYSRQLVDEEGRRAAMYFVQIVAVQTIILDRAGKFCEASLASHVRSVTQPAILLHSDIHDALRFTQEVQDRIIVEFVRLYTTDFIFAANIKNRFSAVVPPPPPPPNTPVIEDMFPRVSHEDLGDLAELFNDSD